MMMNLMVDGVKKRVYSYRLNLPKSRKRSGKRRGAGRTTKQTCTKGKNRTKKNLDGSYGEHLFENPVDDKARDKTVYIRQEYHERLSRIVQVIGKDAIPLYAYLDNILEHHFEMFEKAITDDFNEKFKPIF
jgi:hypothetical protein